MKMSQIKHYKAQGILKASVIVSIVIVLGKLFGFMRDAIIAGYYGATWQTDVFFFAQSMPSMIFPAVCSSLSTAFISLYVSKSINEGEKNGELFASRMLIATIAISAVLSVVAIIVAPFIVPVLAPGFTDIQMDLAIHLTRLTMGAFILTMANYMLSAILNSKKLFYASQIAALAYNLVVILVTIKLGYGQSMDVLTITVILGHLVQVIMLIAFIWRKFEFTLLINPFHQETKILIKLALPILLGNSIVQINNIVDKLLASLLESGAVSALSYSGSLNRFVTGVFITTLSTVLYPSFTESIASKNIKKFNSELLNSLTLLPMFVLPISIITTICAKDIVSIVYERGVFDSNATELTAAALTFYAAMYVFSSVQEVIIRAFYALKDTKTPMINATIAIVANSIMSIILLQVMGIGGIALGTTISTAFASVILWFSLKKKLPNLKITLIYPTIIKMIISSVVMVFLLMFVQQYLIELTPILKFLLNALIGFVIYFGCLLFLKCKEIVVVFKLFKKKLFR